MCYTQQSSDDGSCINSKAIQRNTTFFLLRALPSSQHPTNTTSATNSTYTASTIQLVLHFILHCLFIDSFVEEVTKSV